MLVFKNCRLEDFNVFVFLTKLKSQGGKPEISRTKVTENHCSQNINHYWTWTFDIIPAKSVV